MVSFQILPITGMRRSHRGSVQGRRGQERRGTCRLPDVGRAWEPPPALPALPPNCNTARFRHPSARSGAKMSTGKGSTGSPLYHHTPAVCPKGQAGGGHTPSPNRPRPSVGETVLLGVTTHRSLRCYTFLEDTFLEGGLLGQVQ